MRTALTLETLTDLFNETIAALREEPEFQWGRDRTQYATDDNGQPLAKLAIGNVPLDYDLWEGLRNPAVAGLYPAGLQEIWEYYANKRKRKVDEGGRQTIFQIPRSFEYAREDYGRAALISVMLPFSPQIMAEYAQIIQENRQGSSHILRRMMSDVDRMLDKATSRVGIELVAEDRVVVAMDNATVAGVSTEAVPQTRQGVSHGACKGGNYPQKSLAALMGLGQFGAGRFIIRDELVNGEVQRFVGRLRSIVVFDKGDLATQNGGGIIYPTPDWRKFLFELADLTQIDSDVNRYRFCGYIPQDDAGCAQCVSYCPSGALANSVPTLMGDYPDRISTQTHRFWDGELQFDYARCIEEQQQMGSLFPEWSCGRCVAICATQGTRRASAVKRFHTKKLELTTM